MSITKLNKLRIEKFRALKNVEVEFGDYITVICGKNGTSKSSILGIAAQIFSFEKDYVKNEELRDFKQITNKEFKSQYSDHFRFSEKFDVPGSLMVNVELHDGYTDQSETGLLELMTRTNPKTGAILPRAVVRKNSTAPKGENTSRNFTHPVIFLSLKRMYPIADRDYKVISYDYQQKHNQEFMGLSNELLNRSSSRATGTGGTINSAVAHGENYDHESVSVGEDNAGQIVLALMSFRKLQEEYQDYKGGLLLIDEADAGLFPAAQLNLLEMLERECKTLNLQVVMTSHSPTLIGYAYEQSQDSKKRYRYKTIYLSDTYGAIEVKQDWSWAQISADIHATPIPAAVDIKLPQINVYLEDQEASDFFDALMYWQPIKKFIAKIPAMKSGCDNYLSWIRSKVPEFSERSVICLDADAVGKVKGKSFKTIVFLPGDMPPDQLIFQYLYNLPASDDFWKNKRQFTRSFFTNIASEVIRKLGIIEDTVDVKERVTAYRHRKKPEDQPARAIFKELYKSNQFQDMARVCKLWKHWIESHPKAANVFLNNFKTTIHGIMKNAYVVDETKLTALQVRLKKEE